MDAPVNKNKPVEPSELEKAQSEVLNLKKELNMNNNITENLQKTITELEGKVSDEKIPDSALQIENDLLKRKVQEAADAQVEKHVSGYHVGSVVYVSHPHPRSELLKLVK